MNVYSVDELLMQLIKIKTDGYCYVEVMETDADEFEGEILPPSICFTAVDDYGYTGIDYDGVDAVSDEEVEQYAKWRSPAHHSRPNIILTEEVQHNEK